MTTTHAESVLRGRCLPSDGLLWGSDAARRPGKRPGRPAVPGDITVTTRLGKSRPSVVVRLRHQWYKEVAGWEIGDRLTVDFHQDSDHDKCYYCGFIGRAKGGERGHVLQRRTRSLDAALVVPLHEELPYLPEARPLTSVEYLSDDREGCWIFTVLESKDPVRTVGDVLRDEKRRGRKG